MKLICEIHDKLNVLEEDVGGKKTLFVEGPALVGNKPNKNGRVYNIDILREAVDLYIKDHLKEGRAVGELGHPEGPNINLHRISHKFTDIRESKGDNLFIAKAKLLDTPMGDIAQKLVKEGVTLGFSSRGMGSLKKNDSGIMEVQNDFKIATAADIVADPSAPGAFVKGIMEDVEWFYDIAKGTWVERKVEQIHEELHKLTVKQIQERKLAYFQAIMEGLSKK